MKSGDIRTNAGKMVQLQLRVPFLFRLVEKLPAGPLPPAFVPLLDNLWNKVTTSSPFTQSENEATPYPPAENEFVETLSFFPCLPKLCARGSYKADKGTTRYTCRKLGRSNHVLLPGVVTMHCQHGKCVSSFIAFFLALFS